MEKSLNNHEVMSLQSLLQRPSSLQSLLKRPSQESQGFLRTPAPIKEELLIKVASHFSCFEFFNISIPRFPSWVGCGFPAWRWDRTKQSANSQSFKDEWAPVTLTLLTRSSAPWKVLHPPTSLQATHLISSKAPHILSSWQATHLTSSKVPHPPSSNTSRQLFQWYLVQPQRLCLST